MDQSPVPNLAWVVAQHEGASLYEPIFSALRAAGFSLVHVPFTAEDAEDHSLWLHTAAPLVQGETVVGGFGPGALLACALADQADACGLFLGYVPRQEVQGLMVERMTRTQRLTSRVNAMLGRRRAEVPISLRASAARLILQERRHWPLLTLIEGPGAEAAPVLHSLYMGRNKRLVPVARPFLQPADVVSEFARFFGVYWPEHPSAEALDEDTLQQEVARLLKAALDRICDFMCSTVNGPCAMIAYGGTEYLIRRGYPARIAAGDPRYDGAYNHYWTVVTFPHADVHIDWLSSFPRAPRLLSGDAVLQALEMYDPYVDADRSRFFREVFEWAPRDERWWQPFTVASD